MSVKISIIMVDGGFRENFASLSYWLDQTLPEDTYELIWVEYTDTVAPQIAGMPRVRSKALGRTEEPQILAHCFNEGAKMARGDILVFPDADVACERDLLETIVKEIDADPDLVLYVLRLDQPERHFEQGQNLEHLKKTCSMYHTHNYGGCTAVAKKWIERMNGYEQLPFFAGYHFNGGDNYIRYKNMGLKIRWHPTQRVYHAWHPLPPSSKRSTVSQQVKFILHRAATWDWQAFDGIDASRNRHYEPDPAFPSEWHVIVTERGRYENPEAQPPQAQQSQPPKRIWRTAFADRGPVRGLMFIISRVFLRLAGSAKG